MPENLPLWVYRDRKPENDRTYFENLTRVVFEAGMSWRVIANKWPNFPPAFSGFDIDKVAAYGAEDIKRLTGDASIIRNHQKILATLRSRMKRVGKGTAHIFLWSVGEPITYDPSVHTRRPTEIV